MLKLDVHQSSDEFDQHQEEGGYHDEFEEESKDSANVKGSSQVVFFGKNAARPANQVVRDYRHEEKHHAFDSDHDEEDADDLAKSYTVSDAAEQDIPKVIEESKEEKASENHHISEE